MGHKIITEEDFWICTEGAMPSTLQGTRKSLHNFNGKFYITKEDTSTSSWIDFGCKKMMLLMAIAAALIVVVAVAVGVLTVATGGLGLIALGAVAGLVGGVVGAVVGGMLCGHKMGPARKWIDSKSDLKLQGVEIITGGCQMECKAGGIVQFAPNIKSWLGAIGYAGLSYGSELVKCAFAGAAVGTVGTLLGVGAVAAPGGAVGSGVSLSRAAMILSRPTVGSVLTNIGASFGIGTGWTGAGIALGARGIFGSEAAARTHAIGAVDENGNPVSAGGSFINAALPEYEFATRMQEKGLSGLQWSDALLGLYLLNVKADPPGTYRAPNGSLRNARNNPSGKPPGSIAADPRTARSGGNGRAYENGRPSYRRGVEETTYNNAKDVNGKVYDPESGAEIVWQPGQARQGVWNMGHRPGFEYRHLLRALREGRITQEEFLNQYNNPAHYRPETPHTSSVGAHELDISSYDFDR